MEAEKLKAVELAVEEERIRAAGKRQEERALVEQVWTEVNIMINALYLISNIALKEKEEAGRLREEAKKEREAGRAALQGAQESQARQVELVNRLQVCCLHNNLLNTDLRFPVNIFGLYGGIQYPSYINCPLTLLLGNDTIYVTRIFGAIGAVHCIFIPLPLCHCVQMEGTTRCHLVTLPLFCYGLHSVNCHHSPTSPHSIWFREGAVTC